MSSGADLFVVCKSCQAEVSPYITECPYCGNRLRKRAPKLEKARRQAERRARSSRPKLARLRKGEIPGIRVDPRPYATIVLVLAAIGLSTAWRAGAVGIDRLVVNGRLGDEWWRALTAPFVYDNTGYMLCALGAIAIFGWLLERRHGPLVVLLVFLLGAAGGMLVAATVEPLPFVAAGGNGAALALLCAWVVPDLQDQRRRIETDADMLGVAVIAAVLLLLPVAVKIADPIAGAAGAIVGFAVGLPLAAATRAR
jgi:membrane associated rhomboid family serine protease